MAGHSKWANIKHRKERADAKKGKLFSRVTKEILSAVKQGGPDPKSNVRLRLALQKAREVNMPQINIDRNIKKAQGGEVADYFEITYELYGHGGVGILAHALTDNKNRMASDIRIATQKRGGSIASVGSVLFNFEQKGVIHIPLQDKIDEDGLFLLVTDAGAEDFQKEEEGYLILTAPDKLLEIKEKLEKKGITFEGAELEMWPKILVTCDEETTKANLALIEWLEDLDDVDAVYHNMA